MKWLDEWRDFVKEGRATDFEDMALIINPDGQMVDITLFKTDAYIEYLSTGKGDGVVVGFIVMLKTGEEQGECYDSFQVAQSVATKGYGPFMYDVAMRFATSNGAGLTPTRSSLSSAAAGVWDFYDKKRGDVEKAPFDNIADPKTPPTKDDCKVFGKDSLDKAYAMKNTSNPLEDQLKANAQKLSDFVNIDLKSLSADLNHLANKKFSKSYKGAKYS